MAKYIEKKLLERELNARLSVLLQQNGYYDEYTNGFSECVDKVEEFPSVDMSTSPVKYGKWESGNPICPVCGEDKFKDLDADIWADWKPAFCPNCGAKMDLEE